ncbi:MAG: C-GCAxxG-C-C family protein [Candidatus Neomarinimicrobiota bacterium]|jgi:C_GCAxxG_C_C family probable redox protein
MHKKEKELKNQAQALKYFNEGYNCAQAVLLPYAEELNTDLETLEKISLGFGGGMGRLQKTCGAVTGAFMVISLYCYRLDKNIRSQESRRLIQDFHAQFVAIHGVSDCRTLLDQDSNTEDGQTHIAELNLKKKVCEPCIKDAISILESLFERK